MTPRAIEGEIQCKQCLAFGRDGVAKTKYTISAALDPEWISESVDIICKCGYHYTAEGVYKKV